MSQAGSSSNGDDNVRANTMRTLVMFVARAFYETKYVVVLDQLARHEVMKDDELAGRTGMNNKDLSKLTTRLVNDGLVMVYRQNTSRTGETMSRIVSKGFYYIDHARFCNVVKWRVAEMRRKIDAKLRNELAQQGYVCPNCQKTFEPLDAGHLLRGDAFFCDACDTELIDNSNEEDQASKANRLERFNRQTEKIRDGLKRTEDMIMSKVDIVDWIKKHPTITTPVNGEVKQEDGLAIAGAKPGITQKQVYEVILTADDSEERALKKAREAEASKRKEQNALPSWHTRSTITGDVTAFGLKNNAGMEAIDEPEETKETKPAVDQEVERASIEQYYAKLESESQATSPMDTDSRYIYDKLRPPGSSRNSGLSVPGMNLDQYHGPSSLKRKIDFELDLDGDTPRSAKLSRSASYRSSPQSDNALTPRSDPNGSSKTTPPSSTGGKRMDAVGPIPIQPSEPLVYVNGVAVPLSQITDDHHDLMTPEEYEKYAELVMGEG